MEGEGEGITTAALAVEEGVLDCAVMGTRAWGFRAFTAATRCACVLPLGKAALGEWLDGSRMHAVLSCAKCNLADTQYVQHAQDPLELALDALWEELVGFTFAVNARIRVRRKDRTRSRLIRSVSHPATRSNARQICTSPSRSFSSYF